MGQIKARPESGTPPGSLLTGRRVDCLPGPSSGVGTVGFPSFCGCENVLFYFIFIGRVVPGNGAAE